MLDERPDVVLCYPKTIDIDAEGNELGIHPDNLDLQQATAHERLAHMLRYMRFCNPIFGVMRTEVLRSTGWMRPYGKADRVLLAEMCLRGKYVEYPEPLFYRRLFSGRSLEKYADSADLDRFHNTAAQTPSGYPWTRLFAAHVEAIRHAPAPGAGTGALLRGAVARVALTTAVLSRRPVPACAAPRDLPVDLRDPVGLRVDVVVQLGVPARGATHRRAPLVVADQRVDRGASAASSPAGTTNPVSPSITTSGAPPDCIATTGVPHAWASTSVRPNGSATDALTSTSSARSTSGTSSRGPTKCTSVAEQRVGLAAEVLGVLGRGEVRAADDREVHRDVSRVELGHRSHDEVDLLAADPLARGCPRAARRRAPRAPPARPGRRARVRSVGDRHRGAPGRRSAAHRPGRMRRPRR